MNQHWSTIFLVIFISFVIKAAYLDKQIYSRHTRNYNEDQKSIDDLVSHRKTRATDEPTDMAKSAAAKAKDASDSQTDAANIAAQLVKAQFAEKAIQAAIAAEGALVAKNEIVEQKQKEAAYAKALLQQEDESVRIAENNVIATQQATERAINHMTALTHDKQEAKEMLKLWEKSLTCKQEELVEKQRKRNLVQSRLNILVTRLKGALEDLQHTEQATSNAAEAARKAEENALISDRKRYVKEVAMQNENENYGCDQGIVGDTPVKKLMNVVKRSEADGIWSSKGVTYNPVVEYFNENHADDMIDVKTVPVSAANKAMWLKNDIRNEKDSSDQSVDIAEPKQGVKKDGVKADGCSIKSIEGSLNELSSNVRTIEETKDDEAAKNAKLQFDDETQYADTVENSNAQADKCINCGSDMNPHGGSSVKENSVRVQTPESKPSDIQSKDFSKMQSTQSNKNNYAKQHEYLDNGCGMNSQGRSRNENYENVRTLQGTKNENEVLEGNSQVFDKTQNERIAVKNDAKVDDWFDCGCGMFSRDKAQESKGNLANIKTMNEEVNSKEIGGAESQSFDNVLNTKSNCANACINCGCGMYSHGGSVKGNSANVEQRTINDEGIGSDKSQLLYNIPNVKVNNICKLKGCVNCGCGMNSHGELRNENFSNVETIQNTRNDENIGATKSRLYDTLQNANATESNNAKVEGWIDCGCGMYPHRESLKENSAHVKTMQETKHSERVEGTNAQFMDRNQHAKGTTMNDVDVDGCHSCGCGVTSHGGSRNQLSSNLRTMQNIKDNERVQSAKPQLFDKKQNAEECAHNNNVVNICVACGSDMNSNKGILQNTKIDGSQLSDKTLNGKGTGNKNAKVDRYFDCSCGMHSPNGSGNENFKNVKKVQANKNAKEVGSSTVPFNGDQYAKTSESNNINLYGCTNCGCGMNSHRGSLKGNFFNIKTMQKSRDDQTAKGAKLPFDEEIRNAENAEKINTQKGDYINCGCGMNINGRGSVKGNSIKTVLNTENTKALGSAKSKLSEKIQNEKIPVNSDAIVDKCADCGCEMNSRGSLKESSTNGKVEQATNSNKGVGTENPQSIGRIQSKHNSVEVLPAQECANVQITESKESEIAQIANQHIHRLKNDGKTLYCEECGFVLNANNEEDNSAEDCMIFSSEVPNASQSERNTKKKKPKNKAIVNNNKMKLRNEYAEMSAQKGTENNDEPINLTNGQMKVNEYENFNKELENVEQEPGIIEEQRDKTTSQGIDQNQALFEQTYTETSIPPAQLVKLNFDKHLAQTKSQAFDERTDDEGSIKQESQSTIKPAECENAESDRKSMEVSQNKEVTQVEKVTETEMVTPVSSIESFDSKHNEANVLHQNVKIVENIANEVPTATADENKYEATNMNENYMKYDEGSSKKIVTNADKIVEAEVGSESDGLDMIAHNQNRLSGGKTALKPEDQSIHINENNNAMQLTSPGSMDDMSGLNTKVKSNEYSTRVNEGLKLKQPISGDQHIINEVNSMVASTDLVQQNRNALSNCKAALSPDNSCMQNAANTISESQPDSLDPNENINIPDNDDSVDGYENISTDREPVNMEVTSTTFTTEDRTESDSNTASSEGGMSIEQENESFQTDLSNTDSSQINKPNKLAFNNDVKTNDHEHNECRVSSAGNLSNEEGTDIAQKAEAEAKAASEDVMNAANAVAQQVKVHFAEKAKNAAKAAQAVFVGKQEIVQQIQNEINNANDLLKQEDQAVTIAEYNVNVVKRAIQRAKQHVNALSNDVQVAVENVKSWKHLSSCDKQQLIERIRHREITKDRLSRIEKELTVALNDLENTKMAASNAAAAAKKTQEVAGLFRRAKFRRRRSRRRPLKFFMT